MFNFLFANFGINGVRADVKNEYISLFNPFLDVPLPIDRGRNAFPIDPEFHALVAEGLG
jgi:hypothetical protein